MTTMNDKIRLIKNLKKQVYQLKLENRTDLDAIQRNVILLINRFFGESSEYKADLKEIDFPEADPYDDDFPEKEELWYSGREKMVNLLDTMIKDLKMSEQLKTAKVIKPKSNSVFIVHGTDHQPVKELKAILKETELIPIILHEQPSKGMTLIEKLEKYSDVGFAFIILTPDDSGVGKIDVERQIPSILAKNNLTIEEVAKDRTKVSPETYMEIGKRFFNQLKDRARQNVVLEFGYFIGKLGRERVCCLYKGDIELPSDMHGICYVHFQESLGEVKQAILKELEAAGYQLKK